MNGTKFAANLLLGPALLAAYLFTGTVGFANVYCFLVFLQFVAMVLVCAAYAYVLVIRGDVGPRAQRAAEQVTQSERQSLAYTVVGAAQLAAMIWYGFLVTAFWLTLTLALVQVSQYMLRTARASA